MRIKQNCKYYEECSAPLCPMVSDAQNKNYCWYPDEEICRRRKGIPAWVKQQRKVAKKAMPESYQFYFLIDMLKVPFRVTKSVRGLDPNLPLDKEDQQLKAWRRKNKGTNKRKVSVEALEKKRKTIKLARRAKMKGQKCEKAA